MVGHGATSEVVGSPAVSMVVVGAAWPANPERVMQLRGTLAAMKQPPPVAYVTLKDVVSAGELVDALFQWRRKDFTGLISATKASPVEVLWELAMLLREHAR